jgi:hypothetical protein
LNYYGAHTNEEWKSHIRVIEVLLSLEKPFATVTHMSPESRFHSVQQFRDVVAHFLTHRASIKKYMVGVGLVSESMANNGAISQILGLTSVLFPYRICKNLDEAEAYVQGRLLTKDETIFDQPSAVKPVQLKLGKMTREEIEALILRPR